MTIIISIALIIMLTVTTGLLLRAHRRIDGLRTALYAAYDASYSIEYDKDKAMRTIKYLYTELASSQRDCRLIQIELNSAYHECETLNRLGKELFELLRAGNIMIADNNGSHVLSPILFTNPSPSTKN